MTNKYPQEITDDLFEDGDRDHQFLNEFLGVVSHFYPEPFKRNPIILNKNIDQKLSDALLLMKFFIASKAYVGFYTKNYKDFDATYDNPQEFEDFIRKSVADDVRYIDRITGEDRFTVGLKKIKHGEKAPPVTPEIERIFDVFPDNSGSAGLSKKTRGFWARVWRK
jgi:hypothetical protein